MAEENIIKKTGAERQAEVLVSALERASEKDGILLNAKPKTMPRFYDKSLRITPVNALIMAMHSDNGEFKTNVYTMFNETHDRSEAVKKGERSPFHLAEPQSVRQQRQCRGENQPCGIRCSC